MYNNLHWLKNKKIIGLYACGMSVRDIQSEMEELYGLERSNHYEEEINDYPYIMQKTIDTIIANKTNDYNTEEN